MAFLVGAGRSGTTLLQKLLCLHPRVAYISNYENRFSWLPDGLACGAIAGRLDAKLGAWFDRGGNAYFSNRPWFKKIFPTPHEGEAIFASLRHPVDPGVELSASTRHERLSAAAIRTVPDALECGRVPFKAHRQ